MRNSLTLRLTLYFGVASTLVLIAIGYLVGIAVERHFVEIDRTELVMKKELVRRTLAGARSRDDLAMLDTRLQEGMAGTMETFVRLTAADGSLLYATDEMGGTPGWPAGFTGRPVVGEDDEIATWQAGSHLYRGLRAPVATPFAAAPATLALAIGIDHHAEFMRTFRRTLWVAIALGILVTGVFGWIAARRGLAPVRSMASVAQTITASRLDDRLDVASLPTELTDLAQAFNAMLSRLQDSFRRLTEFSSDLAHELRTPISNLMTQTQVALSRARAADEYRDVLYSNAEEFERLSRMIADMLFLAKSDNGLIVPESESVDLAREVRDLFDYYDALVEERGVKLALAGDGRVRGERLMLRRAISNLLSNAVNHTARGGQVDVSIATLEGGGVRLAVANRGETIPAEHLPRLFDRFYRVDPARQRLSEGAGLGLAITKSIVTAHGGTVRAFSADGVTRIEMEFPPAMKT